MFSCSWLVRPNELDVNWIGILWKIYISTIYAYLHFLIRINDGVGAKQQLTLKVEKSLLFRGLCARRTYLHLTLIDCVFNSMDDDFISIVHANIMKYK